MKYKEFTHKTTLKEMSMNKLLLSMSLMGMSACFAGAQPLQIAVLALVSPNCALPVDATLEVGATGGTAPYTFTLPGLPPVTSPTSATFIIPATTTAPVVTITDSAVPTPATIQVSASPVISSFLEIILVPVVASCSGVELVCTVVPFVTVPVTTLASVSLTSPNGFSQTLTSPGDGFTFPNLKPGKYTMVLTPAVPAGSPANCTSAVTLVFDIADTPLALTSVTNPLVSQGATSGEIDATLSGGRGPLTVATVTGPLPATGVTNGTLTGSVVKFTGLAGGFYNLKITDSVPCTVTQNNVQVNFFADPAANRIALAYCAG